jgi:hypothetical protein
MLKPNKKKFTANLKNKLTCTHYQSDWLVIVYSRWTKQKIEKKKSKNDIFYAFNLKDSK